MGTSDPDTLTFYTQPATMTSTGRFAPLFDALPRDVAGLMTVAQGLLVHEHLAGEYGLTLSEEQRSSVHDRPVTTLLEQIVARDDRPLDTAREPAGRLPGNCRHFTVLMVAMLRAQGTPARARCGFGGYFGTGGFEDHWVAEYWNGERGRWILVDAQIDARQREMFPVDFDLTDVPRDAFLVGGDAWQRHRAGTVDADLFGLTMLEETGDWWIAANLMRDAAALTGTELLPWDVWGAMPGPDSEMGEDLCLLLDRLAVLTTDPDTHFAELTRTLRDDARVRVPDTVRNALRKRDEAV
ncbi:transglutaminase-like domain-containing protein [Streptomyces sp. NBC_01498]|uniref:transglutaminase domain-containing protein n=1 Tax=Streptomyces sp. NBC_01498 TaxID=2975870 RepID=UPI002E7BCD19|nr:transglutaminase-like domain-containing protein [Streptomyces sp. NBC_01498]WTL28466.1 transglutaminase-like domain-containing protein [Streptomyces sp. NBC_01498]